MMPTAYPPRKNVAMPTINASAAAWFMSVPFHVCEDVEAIAEAGNLRLRFRWHPHHAGTDKLSR